MQPKTRQWQTSLSFGHAPGEQLRAALCLLALARLRPTFMRQRCIEWAWMRLLNLSEQQEFYALLKNGQSIKSHSAKDIVDGGPAYSTLHLTHSDLARAPLAEGHPWLGVVGGADVSDDSALLPGGGRKVWQLGTGTHETMVRGHYQDDALEQPQGAIWRLPWPVHACFLMKAASLGTGLLWIAGAQNPHHRLKRLHEVRQQFDGPITVFDAYGRYDRQALRQALPEGFQVLGMADAQARRQAFGQCSVYEVDGDPANGFDIEAAALGLTPWQGALNPGPRYEQHHIVDVAQLMARVVDVMEASPSQRADSKRRFILRGQNGRQVHVVPEPEPLPRIEAEGQGPARQSVGLMLWGPLGQASSWKQLSVAVVRTGCEALFAQVGPHTAAMAPLMMAYLSKPQVRQPQYHHHQTTSAVCAAALQWLNHAPADSVLQVVVPTWDGALLHDLREQVKAWQGRAQSSAGALPVIAVNSSSDFRVLGPSGNHVGSAVASHDITWGTCQAAPGRFEPKWLRYAGKDYDVASLFMHALTQPMLANASTCSATLWSASTLRLGLQHNAVDGIFMASGPLGASVQTMRSIYAQRPVPWVAVLHGMHSPSFQYDIAAFMMNGPIYPFDGFISPSQCGRTVFLNLWQSLQEWLRALGQTLLPNDIDVAVIPYGVDTEYFARRHPLACRQNLRLPLHGILILTLGRISRRFKTCLMPLLLSMQQLKSEGAKATLVIAGALMAQGELKRLKAAVNGLDLNDCVQFRTNLDVEEKAQMLSAADIFVALSDSCQETHGLAPIEAMAAGLPVVAAAWNGFREIVQHGTTGFLVPTAWSSVPEASFVDNIVDKQQKDMGFDDLHETVVTDVAALTHGLLTLIQNPQLRQRMGAAGSARAKEQFDTRKQGVRIADHLIDKVQQAKTSAKNFVQPLGMMMVDRVDRRFAHYASQTIDETAHVMLGPRAADPRYREVVMDYIGAQDRGEAEAVDAIVQAAQAAGGPVPMTALLSPQVDMLRLMRCLKYNLLCLAPKPL